MSLADTGFGSPGAQTPFHFLSVQGRTGTGKTHIVGSAPGIVAVQSSDGRWDGVLQKFPDWKDRFVVRDYFVNIDLSADELFREDKKAEALALANKQADRINQETWLPISQDFKGAISDPFVRTIVWDQADEFNEWLKLANFGKLEKNPQLAYGPINAEYKGLLNQARLARKNMIVINQMKREYKQVYDVDSGKNKSVDTGNYIRRGNESADYLVHSFVETDYIEPTRDSKGEVVKEGEFRVKIIKAKLNPKVNGEVLIAPDWPTLMMFLAPDVPGEAWL